MVPLVERGPLLLPVPADGRGPEIALHLARTGCCDICIDNAMRSAFGRLAGSDRSSARPGISAELERLAQSAQSVAGPHGVMLAATADGSGGETARLLAQWEHEREPAVVFTGYVPPGTPADRLVKSGRARYLRWNVHPPLSDNVRLVRSVGAGRVVPAFCDRKHLSALATALSLAEAAMDTPIEL